ncbi:hypothetical protein V0R52_18440 [Pseudomonas asiatica]|uniref:hypothetical protein n=1 Tax=Pseudomonas TaxID=286 RepID=UPI002E7AD014|nr:hypothetical protein [Pseudomonas asiatica]MEE1918372.1 hypothetical protein [Pseudomonas asiatica]
MTSISPPLSQLTALNGAAKTEAVSDPTQQAFENELLIKALHNTQEQLERVSIELYEKKCAIDALSSKLEKLYAKYPNYWEADSICHSIIEDKSGKRKITWTVSKTELSNKKYNSLKFETEVHNGITGIKFHKSCEDLDFFKNNPKASELNCLPVNGSYSIENNKFISSIGSSDWKAINDLISKLKAALINNEFPEIPKDLSQDISNGLGSLKHVFDNWPKIIRYDAIELIQHIHSTEYQALDLSISNLEIESVFVPKFSYRVSSVNEPGKNFGQFPRIEFDENSAVSFEKWFPETSDHRGNRLELRFADPDEMDISVWKKLSQRDQILIAANISILSDTLKKLKAKSNTELGWDAWVKLSEKLKKILAHALKSQKPRSPLTSK